MFCFLAEAVDFPSIQNIRTVHLAVVGPSPVFKQLMHEADHSALFSADVTDQCSCNCASPLCLQAEHRDIFTFYHCVGGMTSISMCKSFFPTENEGSMESWNIVLFYSTMLCYNTECYYLIISIKCGSLGNSMHVGFPSV